MKNNLTQIDLLVVQHPPFDSTGGCRTPSDGGVGPRRTPTDGGVGPRRTPTDGGGTGR